MSANEILGLAYEFKGASRQIASALYDVMAEQGEAFAEDWRGFAEGTVGEHGKHYPKSISSETKVALRIVVEVGPETGRPQGGMGPGFEFGSRNQPPHLDGANALFGAEARIPRATDAAIGFLLP